MSESVEETIYGRGIPESQDNNKLQPITVSEMGMYLSTHIQNIHNIHNIHNNHNIHNIRTMASVVREHADRFGSLDRAGRLDPERIKKTRRLLREDPTCAPLGAVEGVLLANLGALSEPRR